MLGYASLFVWEEVPHPYTGDPTKAKLASYSVHQLLLEFNGWECS